MGERLLLEGADLAGLIVRVREELGPGARIVRAEKVRSGGFGGFFARERYELTIDVPELARAPRRRFTRPTAASLDDLLEAADQAERTGAPFAAAPAGLAASTVPGPVGTAVAGRPATEVAAPADPAPVSTASARFAAVLDQVRALAEVPPPAEVEVPAPTSAGTLAAAGTAPAPGLAPQSDDALRAALTAAGVPAALLTRTPLTLGGVLAQLPPSPVPPRQSGQVLVLVGPPLDVEETADLIAHRWALPPQAVVKCGPGAMSSATATSRWRATAPREDHPWIVTVPVRDERLDREQAAALVAAARPDQVWAVVDGRTKPEDTGHWLAQVGRQRAVDALAVRGLFDTRAPGTVLGLDLPIALADGVPSSPVVWAALLGQDVDAARA
ncbi:MAG: hypothetical protein BGO38_00040 [Cellulomonas sp. 73-145]|uniref:hypothetical protein n=1 Tax=Cellulomonas sp. 73-145 TaxID=1895739 RepID=UPI000929E950|nr:hypothetical protein [Cellulomonas sp. 73-145]MBN9327622.1 hypothetical protein [Cellulomonas sp.]OJV59998.1 MAG: hypothetical protein BGO38_00040 [Cellulomonas sp. 73-145]